MSKVSVTYLKNVRFLKHSSGVACVARCRACALPTCTGALVFRRCVHQTLLPLPFQISSKTIMNDGDPVVHGWLAQ